MLKKIKTIQRKVFTSSSAAYYFKLRRFLQDLWHFYDVWKIRRLYAKCMYHPDHLKWLESIGLDMRRDISVDISWRNETVIVHQQHDEPLPAGLQFAITPQRPEVIIPWDHVRKMHDIYYGE